MSVSRSGSQKMARITATRSKTGKERVDLARIVITPADASKLTIAAIEKVLSDDVPSGISLNTKLARNVLDEIAGNATADPLAKDLARSLITTARTTAAGVPSKPRGPRLSVPLTRSVTRVSKKK